MATKRGAGELRIALPAEADSVTEIRRRVREYAAERGLSDELVFDLTTVVSEACGNVVRYAYDQARVGPLEVTVREDGDEIEIRVRDRGRGIRPRAGGEPPGVGLGLPLIGALSSVFFLRSELGVGTELGMRIAVPPAA